MSVGAERPGSPVEHRPRVTILPATYLGRWAIGLAVAFFVLVLATSVVPRGAALGFACGLAGGVAALIAILRDEERAVSVFAALTPLLIVVGFALAQAIATDP
jgi:hypothetical protein